MTSASSSLLPSLPAEPAEKKRKNRWGSSVQQQVPRIAAEQRIPSLTSCAYVEPYVSDSEAMNALLASAASSNPSKEVASQTIATKEQYNRPSQRQKHDEDGLPKWGKDLTTNTASSTAGEESAEICVEKEKPNFAVSGALATDAQTGNVYKGILLKFHEPPEARVPVTQWRLYVFASQDRPDIYHISKQSAYLFGREHSIADVPLSHPSCSKQHAVLQYRAVPQINKKDGSTKIRCKPYLMDLQSTNGTFINGIRIEDSRYYELQKQDVITFGTSSREYVLMAE